MVSVVCDVFFFKQKTAYEVRISDWSSDVCSSDLCRNLHARSQESSRRSWAPCPAPARSRTRPCWCAAPPAVTLRQSAMRRRLLGHGQAMQKSERSEEHTSELQSLMRISYAGFCLKKKNKHKM